MLNASVCWADRWHKHLLVLLLEARCRLIFFVFYKAWSLIITGPSLHTPQVPERHTYLTSSIHWSLHVKYSLHYECLVWIFSDLAISPLCIFLHLYVLEQGGWQKQNMFSRNELVARLNIGICFHLYLYQPKGTLSRLSVGLGSTVGPWWLTLEHAGHVWLRVCVLGGQNVTLSAAEMLISPQEEGRQQKKINTENFSAQPSCSHCKAVMVILQIISCFIRHYKKTSQINSVCKIHSPYKQHSLANSVITHYHHKTHIIIKYIEQAAHPYIMQHIFVAFRGKNNQMPRQ